MTALILGTAQFGTPYGVTNSVGRLEDADIHDILVSAVSGGIRLFDTAADYGDSQQRLGALAPRTAEYITKFHLRDDGASPTADGVYGDSQRALGADTLAGVMFHRVADLGDDRAPVAVEILRRAVATGHIARAGVSIYDAHDLELALSVFPDLTLLQIPGNLLDRRLLDHPRVAQLRYSGVEIHVRSAFLQGLLLRPPQPTGQFAGLAGEIERLSKLASESGSTMLGLALGFLRDHPSASGVIVGVTTLNELSEIQRAWRDATPVTVPVGSQLPVGLIDPRHWTKGNS